MQDNNDNNDDNHDNDLIDSFISKFMVVGDDNWIREKDEESGTHHQQPEHPTSSTSNNNAHHTFSGLEIVLMMKGNLEQVRRVYEMNPKALTHEVVSNVCRMDGCQPGVLVFLAKQLPNPATSLLESDRSDKTPIQYAMDHGPGPDRPTENDVIELMNSCPESILFKDETTEEFCAWDCAVGAYSTGLINRMCQKLVQQEVKDIFLDTIPRIPSASDLANPRDEICCSYYVKYHARESDPRPRQSRVWEFNSNIDMEIINSVTPLLSTVEFFGSNPISSWTLEAWVKALEVLLQNPNLTELELELDFAIRATDYGNFITEKGVLQPSAFQSLFQLAPTCSITSVKIGVDALKDDATGGYYQLVLDLVKCMPRLQKLRVYSKKGYGNHTNKTSSLCHLLRTNTNLTSLRLRVCCSGYGNDDTDRLLEAVAASTTLTVFELELHGSMEYVLHGQKRLLEIIKTRNTTLRDAKIDQLDRAVWEKPSIHQQTITYYTRLNRFGRAKARDPTTSMTSLVRLLDNVMNQEEEGSTDHRTKYLFGILRESPSLWSDHCCRQGRRHRASDHNNNINNNMNANPNEHGREFSSSSSSSSRKRKMG